MDFEKILNEHLEDLLELLRINSVYDEKTACESMPYGKGVHDALAFMKELAEKDGFIVKEYNHEVLSISYMDYPNRHIDIASHLDVVAVDNQWTVDPFGAHIIDGKLYGRGAEDMKTAAFLSYLCLILLRKNYPETPNEIRLVFGSDEERTMADMRRYITCVTEPLFAFSPDGKFPMGIGEKGALMWTLSGRYEGIIEKLQGGIQCNIVAPKCVVTLKNSSHQKKIENYLKRKHLDADVKTVDNKTVLSINGKAVHCSQNWLGQNAIIEALRCIDSVCKDDFCHNLVQLFGPNFGQGLNQRPHRKKEDNMTVNLGVLTIENEEISAQVDGRYPSDLTSALLSDALKQKCVVDVSLDYDDPPTLCTEDDPYVKTMLSTYRHLSKDNMPPFISGGVSYAKVFGHCVTFGLCPSDENTRAHQHDEFVELKNVVKAFEIYYRTIEKLAFLKGE